jgi:hypothetical protein
MCSMQIFSLLASKLKSLKKQKKDKYCCGAKIYLNVLEVKDTNSFLYKIKVLTTLYCNLNLV